MSDAFNCRAAELAKGDVHAWRIHAVGLPAEELYALGDELAAMIRHPVTWRWTSWRQTASERLAVLLEETDRRWQVLWANRSNNDISNQLDAIWTAQ